MRTRIYNSITGKEVDHTPKCDGKYAWEMVTFTGRAFAFYRDNDHSMDPDICFAKATELQIEDDTKTIEALSKKLGRDMDALAEWKETHPDINLGEVGGNL